MSDAEFEAMFEESMKHLDAYIATQITDRQISQARRRRHNVEQNKSFWKHCDSRGEHLILCVQCGAIDAGHYREPIKTQMFESGKCFHCNHWDNEVQKVDPARLIIDGHIYVDGGNQPNTARKEHLGFGGYVWTIECDGHVWQTNNLWSGSTVPQEHRASLPDNARFVREA
ncbi:hypothetical protein KTD31_17135 [Burkholderia multivorans]|uniref:hypothetical protein n=1 Tax=Burkholderia multivorans TaxID=87883 RepID=UPI001C22CA08|nr:hypothetical protein [Burkholderia multivorans]MBU9203083.1 hypothetical protein [Burkholderia multivorans]MCA8385322.1 hypothetical protein [Burkholderia multivorans]